MKKIYYKFMALLGFARLLALLLTAMPISMVLIFLGSMESYHEWLEAEMTRIGKDHERYL